MLLLAAVVGSGIMGERLSGGNSAITLLANAIAIILAFGPISGAHFNPVVTLVTASQGGLKWRDVSGYVSAQVLGAFTGVAAAHLMFGEPLFSASHHVRAGGAQVFSEFIATFGLLSIILGCAGIEGRRPNSEVQEFGLRPSIPFAVGAYITAAYWFTSSTSFANPAVTLARAFTDSFAGIRPADAPGFFAAQFIGASMAALLFRWLHDS
jgi:glycerol uptake facilitator-like aquaporin